MKFRPDWIARRRRSAGGAAHAEDPQFGGLWLGGQGNRHGPLRTGGEKSQGWLIDLGSMGSLTKASIPVFHSLETNV